MKLTREGMTYLGYLAHMAPDITHADILRLADFRPRWKRCAYFVNRAFRG